MLKQLYYIGPAMFCCYLNAPAQQTEPDTASRESLEELVVTATRTPRPVNGYRSEQDRTHWRIAVECMQVW